MQRVRRQRVCAEGGDRQPCQHRDAVPAAVVIHRLREPHVHSGGRGEASGRVDAADPTRRAVHLLQCNNVRVGRADHARDAAEVECAVRAAADVDVPGQHAQRVRCDDRCGRDALCALPGAVTIVGDPADDDGRRTGRPAIAPGPPCAERGGGEQRDGGHLAQANGGATPGTNRQAIGIAPAIRRTRAIVGHRGRSTLRASQHASSKRVAPAQLRETGETPVGRNPFAARFQGQRGQVRVRYEIALCPTLHA